MPLLVAIALISTAIFAKLAARKTLLVRTAFLYLICTYAEIMLNHAFQFYAKIESLTNAEKLLCKFFWLDNIV